MRTIPAIILSFVSHAVIAVEGNIPEICAEYGPYPEKFHCPVPYTEMGSDGTKTIIERAWVCQKTGYMMGWYGTGCMRGWRSSSGKTNPFPAWSEHNTVLDHRHEVREHVVDPCYLLMAKKANIAGMSHQEAAEMMKSRDVESYNQVVESVHKMLSLTSSFADRKSVYYVMRMECIKAVLSAM